MENKEIIDFIENRPTQGPGLGLDRMAALMKVLGNPQDKLNYVHIAGSNGKGSASAFISNVLIKAGYKTGTYISPHLIDYKERFSINGINICDKDFEHVALKVKEASEKLDFEPRVFEVLTAMAFVYFEMQKCDIVILEVGMGGRFDATNIIKNSEVSLVMNIGLEHTKILGNTLKKIAFEKASIIKENGNVVVYEIDELIPLYKKMAKERKANLRIADFSKIEIISEGLEKQVFNYKQYKNMEIALLGRHQFFNAAVVLEALDVLKEKGYKLNDKIIRTAFADTCWPARLSILSKKPLFILDGAHNSQCAKALAESLKTLLKRKKVIVITGVLKDKKYKEIIDYILPFASEFITIMPNSERALDNKKLAVYIKKQGKTATTAETVKEALLLALEKSKCKKPILAFGSLYLAGDISKEYPKVYKEYLRREYKRKRNTLSKKTVEANSALVVNKIRRTREYKEASNILIYNSIRNEVDLSALKKDNKVFAYPLCINDKEMLALIPESEDAFKKGAYGINEPIREKSKEMKDIDLIICPLVAFDLKGNRLGNGKGYYDTFLKNNKCSVLGAAFDIQLAEEIPMEEHDKKLTLIITEKRTVRNK